jgi:hypothetical protein
MQFLKKRKLQCFVIKTLDPDPASLDAGSGIVSIVDPDSINPDPQY